MKIQQILPMGWVVLVMASFAMAQTAPSQRWDFDKDPPGQTPAGFEAYSGQWKVKPDLTAPSQPNVLAQEATDQTWPGIVARDTNYKDLWAEVKFKTIFGSEDQSAGIIFRFKDKGNFYVLRPTDYKDNV